MNQQQHDQDKLEKAKKQMARTHLQANLAQLELERAKRQALCMHRFETKVINIMDEVYCIYCDAERIN